MPISTAAQNSELTTHAQTVLEKRYLRKGKGGEPIETIEEMFWRVARHVAAPDSDHGKDAEPSAQKFYRLLTELRFLPNSPTFTGAGTPLGQLAACFVLPIDDDMGRNSSGIFQTLRDAALIQQTGGGNGFAFSRLRPKGDYVATSAGHATGPVGFMRVYDQAFGEIAQGGTRRGANMAVLRVDHPDIEEFISCKAEEGSIENFNISVGITDAFMEAVEMDADFDLINPRNGKVWRTVRARSLFEKIVKHAHHNGEPGLLFLDAANRSNPVPHLYALETTNPCGEQWLGPYESCCLGSINLARHVTETGEIDWEALQVTIEEATHFLDNVISANHFVPAVPQLKESADNARRIGLGIMGLADVFYRVGVRYGSKESLDLAGKIMEFVRYHCMKTSVSLAQERGAFPAIKGSIYDPSNFRFEIPSPLVDSNTRWGRPSLDWQALVRKIKKHGIRNAAQTTVAPTGTISTVAGCEGYGCEPVFALAYTRYVNDGDKRLPLNYISPLFEAALVKAGISPKAREEIIRQTIEGGSCQNLVGIPEDIRNTFVVSGDITSEEHVRMQAAIQAFVDNSISKTCNFPETATEEDVAKAYRQAWSLGCKGLTVYVTGSREKVVLETKAAKKRAQTIETALNGNQIELWHDSKKPRPTVLHGETHRVETPLGTTYVTINRNGGGQPFEVFVQASKAGTETLAVSEAIARLISYVLRLASPVEPRDRLKEVAKQLSGIGGGRPLGFGPNRILSLPDGIARVLENFLNDEEENQESLSVNGQNKQTFPSQQTHLRFGDLCPTCGEASLINEEGCQKCYSCGYSRC